MLARVPDNHVCVCVLHCETSFAAAFFVAAATAAIVPSFLLLLLHVFAGEAHSDRVWWQHHCRCLCE